MTIAKTQYLKREKRKRYKQFRESIKSDPLCFYEAAYFRQKNTIKHMKKHIDELKEMLKNKEVYDEN